MSTEEEFLESWNNKYKLKAIGQFCPTRELYNKLKPDMKITQWKKLHNYGSYKSDFMIPCKKLWLKGITVEFDGSGKDSHRGPGAERDRKKSNQLLLMGYITLRFSVTTLKSSFSYVEDMIKDQYKLIKGKEIERIN